MVAEPGGGTTIPSRSSAAELHDLTHISENAGNDTYSKNDSVGEGGRMATQGFGWWRRALRVVGIGLISVACMLVIQSRLPQESTGSRDGEQILGVIPSADAYTEGALATARQWVAVSGSTAFLQSIADRLGIPESTLSSRLRTSMGTDTPIITVRYSSERVDEIERVLSDVSREMASQSARIDPRYTIKPLTGVGTRPTTPSTITRVVRWGVVGLGGVGAGVLVWFILAFVWSYLFRVWRRRRGVKTTEADSVSAHEPTA